MMQTNSSLLTTTEIFSKDVWEDTHTLALYLQTKASYRQTPSTAMGITVATSKTCTWTIGGQRLARPCFTIGFVREDSAVCWEGRQFHVPSAGPERGSEDHIANPHRANAPLWRVGLLLDP